MRILRLHPFPFAELDVRSFPYDCFGNFVTCVLLLIYILKCTGNIPFACLVMRLL